MPAQSVCLILPDGRTGPADLLAIFWRTLIDCPSLAKVVICCHAVVLSFMGMFSRVASGCFRLNPVLSQSHRAVTSSSCYPKAIVLTQTHRASSRFSCVFVLMFFLVKTLKLVTSLWENYVTCDFKHIYLQTKNIALGNYPGAIVRRLRKNRRMEPQNLEDLTVNFGLYGPLLVFAVYLGQREKHDSS